MILTSACSRVPVGYYTSHTETYASFHYQVVSLNLLLKRRLCLNFEQSASLSTQSQLLQIFEQPWQCVGWKRENGKMTKG